MPDEYKFFDNPFENVTDYIEALANATAANDEDGNSDPEPLDFAEAA